MKGRDLFNIVVGTCMALSLVAITMLVMFATVRCLVGGCI